MQALLRDWSARGRGTSATRRVMLDQAALPWFAELNRSLIDRLDDAAFRERIRESTQLMRALAAEIAERAEAGAGVACAARLLAALVAATAAATAARRCCSRRGRPRRSAGPRGRRAGDRGWESRNLVVDLRYTQGNPERAELLARELVKERVDVIVTVVTATAMAARRATEVVPIVMYASGFPVEGGLAVSLARPGGNVTGMTVYAGGGVLFGKFVQLLRELRPSLRELGVFWGYAPPSYRLEQVGPAIDELRRAAKAFNVKVHFWQTGTDSDLGAALSAAAIVPLV